MAKITVNDIRVNQLLNTILGQTNRDNFVRDRILPKVSVLKDSADIPSWGTQHMRIFNLERAPDDRSLHYIESELGARQEYRIRRHDIAEYIPDVHLENEERPFQLVAQKSARAKETLLLQAEDALAATLRDPAILTQNSTPATAWSLPASTPFKDIEDSKTTIFNSVGMEANTIVIPRNVLVVLKQHDDYNKALTNKAVAVSDGEIVNIIKDKHGLNEVIIAKSRKVTSVPGATETKGNVWEDDVILFYKSPFGSIISPSFGYSFELAKHQLKFKTRREPIADKGLTIEGELAFDDRILMPNAGYLIQAAI